MIGGGAFWPKITMKTSKMLFLKCGFGWNRSTAYAKHSPSAKFFAPFGQPKFWVKKGAYPFGYFCFYALEKAICPYLAETLGIPLLHPTTPA